MQRAAAGSLVADLYLGNITYGEFARKRIDLATNSIAAVQKREEELRALAVQQAQAQAQLDVQRSVATITLPGHKPDQVRFTLK